jgi:KDO2-lipid IV(A) lauroyltransferase
MADRGPIARFCVRRFMYPLQALLIGSFYYSVRALPLAVGTAMTSFMFRKIGRHMRVARVAERNIRRVFPELDDVEVEALLDQIWGDLGRGVAEFSHLDRFTINQPGSRVELVGAEHLAAMQESNKAGIVFSAHMGNWELGARVIGQTGLPLGQIYRSADNPFVDRLFKNARISENTTLVPKGRKGAAKMLRLMRDGLHFGAMMDQKLNEGAAIPFFGHNAMTATAPVGIALRTGGSIVPVRCIRYPGSHFRIEVSPPLEIERTDDRKADAIKVMCQINGIIEDWIREYPAQWFWLHRRWPKE